MAKPKELYKTTIVIWSDADPTNMVEIDDLARDAMTGDSYCSEQNTERVTDQSQFPSTEFFDDDDDNDAMSEEVPKLPDGDAGHEDEESLGSTYVDKIGPDGENM